MSTQSVKAGKKTKRIGIIIAVIAAVYLLLAAAIILFIDARHVRFYMSGEAQMEMECDQAYKEPGIYAVTTGRIFGEGEKRLNISVSGEVDNKKLGVQTITYHASFLGKDYYAKRAVTVVDTTPPVIELKHIEGYTPDWFTGYQEEGYTATDNFDGDITDKVERIETAGSVTYKVKDSSGNSAETKREFATSISAPVISIVGEKNMTVNASRSFVDPGYSAKDSSGKDLTDKVQVEGQVIPYKAGTYQLSYSIYNNDGDSSTVTRNVTVVPASRPDTVQPDHRTIYLTFDDGPGPYTERLLDVLDAYGAKATFFVTGTDTNHLNMIGEAYSRGHAIGVHSKSHNYYDIYASEDAFFADFDAVQEIIYQQTGSYTKLSRFPGGSSNTVSKFNPGIMSRLADALNNLGYKYFDWNVSSGDAGETTDTDTVAENIINGCSGRKASVVLQHDIKDYSVAAVEQVLIWGLENGYSFESLDLSSPDAHHGIAN